MGGRNKRRRVFAPVASASLALVLAACGRGEVKSDIELTSPAGSTAAMDAAFGEVVAETAQASPSSQPKDPASEDMAPVSYTAEPIPIPAD